MVLFRAHVKKVNGYTRHLVGEDAAPIPDPTSIELVDEAGMVFLYRLNAAGLCIADTWHESVEAAKSQAMSEYSIEEGDWQRA